MAKIPTMTEVTSNYLHSVGHDGDALFIRFRDKGGPGKLFRYPTAGADLHAALLAAPSPGRHFHAAIKGKHNAEAVDG